VTGLSRGIGSAIAERLARDGLAVVGCSRTLRTTEAAALELRRQGLDVIGVEADVSNESDVARLVNTTVERFGRLDVAVNAAGLLAEASFLDLTLEAWNRTIATNLTGSFLFGQAAAKAMIATDARSHGGGRIVNVASTTGLLAENDCADYNVSKAGVILLTRSMALDLAPYEIAVNCVAPGYITTEMTAAYVASLSADERRGLNPLGRAGDPRDVAQVVSMLCDVETRFVTGSTLLVDGGQSAVSPRPA
jgi:NAD(P)-dependent dehydrogenase (short-subunit alcohol dehydrogenase family)